ncbi:F-box/TPR repeat protein Pof3 [Entomortierella parvispora]|uniref:F-box/TPR repeat protein Pof3 n=1 Tax=Entomortierella parvispora TaxID=205924 RepID=A0A9P3LZX7_9FUNG|nr:F-box/TPR repeat protein Pof3 [Entomortierella parvispora]
MNPVKAALQNKQQRPTPYRRPVAALQPPTAKSRSPPAASSTSASPPTDTIPVNDLVQLARKSFSSREYDVALQLLSQALVLAPQNINLLDSRAACLEKMTKLGDALIDAKAMIRMHPHDPKGYLRAGKILRMQQNFRTATKLFVAGVERSTKGSQDYETLVRMATEMTARMENIEKREAQILDPMDRLPLELIMIIFGSLTFAERVQRLRVSKKWMKYLNSVNHFWFSIELARRIPTLMHIPDHAKYIPIQLDLEKNYMVTNKTVLGLIQNIRPRALWLGCAQECTGALLTQMTKINRTSSLETFSLRLNHKIESQIFSRFWSVTPKLRSLDLHGCSGVSDGVVQAVLTRCPLLEELDISDCPVSESCMTSQSSTQPPIFTMKRLIIGRWENQVSKAGIDGMVARFPNLETLDMRLVRVQGIAALENLSELKGLKHLYTDSLETSGDEATQIIIQKWVEGIPNLESLQMSACKGLSDMCLYYMAAGTGAPNSTRTGWSHSMRMINFSLSPYLTNAGLGVMATHPLPKLHTLILNKCGRLDEPGLLMLLSSSGGELCRLEFGGYRKVSDRLMTALRDHCPKITFLHLANSGELTGSGLLTLVQARGQGLVRICVDNCPQMRRDAVERAGEILGDWSRVAFRNSFP